MITFRRILRTGILILFILILAAAGVSFLSNHGLPTRSRFIDRLDPQEKSFLAEALHLKQTVGESLWPDWSRAEIPLLSRNEQYGFLVGVPDPPPGWERVPGDTFLGNPYYRIQNPESVAFAVPIGNRWAASLPTKEWMQISFANNLRGHMPGFLKPVFPYRLPMQLFNLNSSDFHIAIVLHESFHAFQAETAPVRFDGAKKAYRDEAAYPWESSGLQESWKLELTLLIRAVNAKTDDEVASLAREFLAARYNRRQRHGLDVSMMNYERYMEWLEGLAKYIELGIWREASLSGTYIPLPELTVDPGFKKYKTFSGQWSKELMNMRMQSSRQGDIRFYYSGMAQAFLLDRLQPGWKARILNDDNWLEGLLAEATEKH